MKVDTTKLRTLKVRTEENSEVINQIVDTLVSKYNQELTTLVTEVRNALNSNNEIHIDELERWTLELPTLMYFSGTGMEKLGTESDNAKAIKMEAYNRILDSITEGTVQEKKGIAENNTYHEMLMEKAFARAYKRLQRNIVDAEHLYSGVKKVLQKRMEERELNRRDN